MGFFDYIRNFLNSLKSENFETVESYRLAAEQGDAGAQNNLGLCYQKGFGVPKDYTEAVRWYRLAAEQGFSYAQLRLKSLLCQ